MAPRKAQNLATFVSVYLLGSVLRKGPESKYLVFGPGRSGSTLLANIMGTHPDILGDKEALAHKRPFPSYYVECKARLAARQHAVYGFKMQHNHLEVQGVTDEQAFIDRFSQNGWRHIFLYRENYVRQAISLLTARARDVWHIDNTNPKPRKVIIDPDAVLDQSVAIERSHGIYRRLLNGKSFLEITYENDLIDTAAQHKTCQKLADHLGVDNRFSVDVGLKKTVSGDLSETIENFSEVREKLAGTRFEQWCDRP